MNSEKLPHIGLPKGLGIGYAVMPGDPFRVERVAEYLDEVEELVWQREFRSMKGKYKGIPVMILSTGIGGPSTAIAVEELKMAGVHTMIRIGSCLGMQDKMRLGDLILINGAIREDGASRAYAEECFPAIPDFTLLQETVLSAEDQKFPYHVGITRCHDHIYAENKEERNEHWKKFGVAASDMETAAMFVAGARLGIRTASILNVVAVSQTQMQADIARYADGDTQTATGEKREILTALEAIVREEGRTR